MANIIIFVFMLLYSEKHVCRVSVVYWFQSTVKRPHSKRPPKNGFQNQLSLNAGQKYCRILLTFIKLPFVIKIFVLSFLSGRSTQVLLYYFIHFLCFYIREEYVCRVSVVYRFQSIVIFVP